MSPTPTEIVTGFFEHWRANRVDEAIAMLSEDVMYDNIPLPNIMGRENVRKFVTSFGVGTSFQVDWQIKHIAATGNVVLTERVDLFFHENGGKIALPAMGTFVIREEEICAWRDYFDLGDFERQVAAVLGGRLAAHFK